MSNIMRKTIDIESFSLLVFRHSLIFYSIKHIKQVNVLIKRWAAPFLGGLDMEAVRISRH